METVKFAVVGCGHIGRRHLEVIANDPNAELVAFCDISETAIRQLSKKYNGIKSFTSYEDMLNYSDADVITICTPHGLHAEMGILAAKSGKHVLVEKPMALTTEQ